MPWPLDVVPHRARGARFPTTCCSNNFIGSHPEGPGGDFDKLDSGCAQINRILGQFRRRRRAGNAGAKKEEENLTHMSQTLGSHLRFVKKRSYTPITAHSSLTASALFCSACCSSAVS